MLTAHGKTTDYKLIFRNTSQKKDIDQGRNYKLQPFQLTTVETTAKYKFLKEHFLEIAFQLDPGRNYKLHPDLK